MSQESLIRFPTEFPIKVMGRQDAGLVAVTRPIIERHAGALDDSSIRQRPSGDGNFIAVTFVIMATSQSQLDAIYRELTACEAVLMAL